MFAVTVGVGVSVAVAVGVLVGVAVAVGVGVLVGVGVGVLVGVGVSVAVGVGVSVAVGVGVLLGVAVAPKVAATPSGPIDSAYLKNAPELGGDKVLIEVKWKSGGAEKIARAEDLGVRLVDEVDPVVGAVGHRDEGR